MGEGEGDVVVLECRLKAKAKPNCEFMIDSTNRDSCAKAQTDEFLIVPGLELCTVNLVKEAAEHMELDPSVKTPSNDGMNDTLLELHGDSKKKETLNAIEYENHAKIKAKDAYMDNELTTCMGSLAAEASTDIKFQHSDEKQGKEAANDKNDLELSDKKQTKECLDNVELENGVKEVSNEGVVLEVSNPKFSPRDITSSIQTINSRSVHNIPGGCGEVSSLCSRGSCEEESLSEGGHRGNDGSGKASTSCVVLEIPKHVSTTGIRKIT